LATSRVCHGRDTGNGHANDVRDAVEGELTFDPDVEASDVTVESTWTCRARMRTLGPPVVWIQACFNVL